MAPFHCGEGKGEKGGSVSTTLTSHDDGALFLSRRVSTCTLDSPPPPIPVWPTGSRRKETGPPPPVTRARAQSRRHASVRRVSPAQASLPRAACCNGASWDHWHSSGWWRFPSLGNLVVCSCVIPAVGPRRKSVRRCFFGLRERARERCFLDGAFSDGGDHPYERDTGTAFAG